MRMEKFIQVLRVVLNTAIDFNLNFNDQNTGFEQLQHPKSITVEQVYTFPNFSPNNLSSDSYNGSYEEMVSNLSPLKMRAFWL